MGLIFGVKQCLSIKREESHFIHLPHTGRLFHLLHIALWPKLSSQNLIVLFWSRNDQVEPQIHGLFYKPHYQAKVSDPSLMARFLFSEFVIKMNKMGLVMLTHPFGCRGERKKQDSLSGHNKKQSCRHQNRQKQEAVGAPGRNQKPVCKTVGTCRNGDFFIQRKIKYLSPFNLSFFF